MPTASPTTPPPECWFNLNSGNETVYVASYVPQTIMFGRGGSTIAGTTVAFQTAGQTMVLVAADLGVSALRAGDWLCGATGGISVVGEGGGFERDWVPERLAGTAFLLPVYRFTPQSLFVRAMAAPATVTLLFGTVVQQSIFVPAGQSRMFDAFDRLGSTVTVTSTTPIIGSMASSCEGPNASLSNDPLAAGALPSYGCYDYYPIAPASATAYGIPSQNALFATLGGAAVTIACGGAGGHAASGTPAVGAFLTLNGTRPTFYNGFPCRAHVAASGGLLGVTSFADGDGGDATMWLAPDLMRTTFVIPMHWRYFAIVCTGPGVATVAPANGSAAASVAIAGTPGLGAFYHSFGSGSNAGCAITTSAPCFVVANAAIDGDEVTIFGE
jgi:hypothetical protein